MQDPTPGAPIRTVPSPSRLRLLAVGLFWLAVVAPPDARAQITRALPVLDAATGQNPGGTGWYYLEVRDPTDSYNPSLEVIPGTATGLLGDTGAMTYVPEYDQFIGSQDVWVGSYYQHWPAILVSKGSIYVAPAGLSYADSYWAVLQWRSSFGGYVDIDIGAHSSLGALYDSRASAALGLYVNENVVWRSGFLGWGAPSQPAYQLSNIWLNAGDRVSLVCDNMDNSNAYDGALISDLAIWEAAAPPGPNYITDLASTLAAAKTQNDGNSGWYYFEIPDPTDGGTMPATADALLSENPVYLDYHDRNRDFHGNHLVLVDMGTYTYYQTWPLVKPRNGKVYLCAAGVDYGDSAWAVAQWVSSHEGYVDIDVGEVLSEAASYRTEASFELGVYVGTRLVWSSGYVGYGRPSQGAVKIGGIWLAPGDRVSVVLDNFDNNYAWDGALLDNVLISVSQKQEVELEWATPQPIVYGTPLGSDQLNASAGVSGNFDYSPSLGAVLGAGVHTLTAHFKPTDSATYLEGSVTVVLSVNPAPLTVTADKEWKECGGSLPAFTASYDGFVNGEGIGDLETPVTFRTDANAESPVGNYWIYPEGATSSNYSITFVNGLLTVVLGPPAGLAFSRQPASIVAGEPMDPGPVVAVLDACGSVVSGAQGTVTLRLQANGNGAALKGVTTATVIGGYAAFADIHVERAGTGYILEASADGVTGATSDPFDVMAGPAFRPTFTMQPSDAIAAQAIAPEVRVSITDQYGNVVPTESGLVTVSLTGGDKQATLSGAISVAAAAGTASFGDLRVDRAASGYALVAAYGTLQPTNSTAFDVLAAGPSRLEFLWSPGDTSAGTLIRPAPQVRVLDAVGNLVSTATTRITLSLAQGPAGGNLAGVVTVDAVGGVATFSQLSINLAGSGYVLAASANKVQGCESPSFAISPGPASALVFRQQPSNAVAGSTIVPAVRVAVVDAFGNTVTISAGAVTLSLSANPGQATLDGVTSVDAVDGIAVFDSLSIAKIGTGYELIAAFGGFGGATSDPFDITAAPASALVFRVQPTSITAGAWIAPYVQVAVVDAHGNTVASAADSVTLSLVDPRDPSAAGPTLIGNSTIAASGGIATFTRLSTGMVGQYCLAASAPGLADDLSSSFTVTAGPAKALTITLDPAMLISPPKANEPIPPVVVSVLDAYGNLVPTQSGTVAIKLSTDPNKGKARAKLLGPLEASLADGWARFNGLSIDRPGEGYQFGASMSHPNLSAVSSPFTILP